MDTRFILYHKQSTSARTRFVRYDYHSICAFEPLPDAARFSQDSAADGLVLHPAAAIAAAERRLGLESGSLEADGEFVAAVRDGDEVIPVFLARFTAIDPPFDVAKTMNADFIDLTQARDLPPVELALLRHAYETVMGGG